jgi:hypothetical protein
VRSFRSRRTAFLQAAYYVTTGVWPLVSRRSFEAVTGPKAEYWLVETVGALASVIGVTLGVAAYRNRVEAELVLLGMGSAVGFAAIDVLYARSGRISRIYLVDAAIQIGIVSKWAATYGR